MRYYVSIFLKGHENKARNSEKLPLNK